MEGTNISWAQDTFNPLEGCEKVSTGCANCYAEARDNRFHEGKHWGPNSSRLEHTDAYWQQPLKWNKEAALSGARRRVFCASLSDWLEDHPTWRKARVRLLETIAATPNLEWLLLTKRPENWKYLMEIIQAEAIATVDGHPPYGIAHDVAMLWEAKDCPPANIRFGITVENQAMAQRRIPLLWKIPAKRFLSMEPLLERVNLGFGLGLVGEVIVGGESGPNARPMALEWAIDLREQCRLAGVPFHFKQMGARPTLGGKPYPISDAKGGVWDEFPPELQVRELPEA